MRDHLPILIELVFVFGGVLLFAWWQLHEIKVDQRKAAQERAAEEQARAAAVPADTAPVPSPAPGTLVNPLDSSTEASRRDA
jgi:hypothetical protein